MAKRRRTYIVDRSFQLKYTLLISLVGGVISLIFGAWMWHAHTENTELLVLDEALSIDAALRTEIMAADQHLLWIYLFITLLMIAALGLLGVLVTHRVAGPVYIMTRYLSVLAEGAYPNLRPLRKKDEFKTFFSSLENAVGGLRRRDKEEAEALDEALKKLEGADAGALQAIRSVRDRKLQSVAGATIENAGDDESSGEEAKPE